MSFSTVTYLANLRPSLDSWRQNESKSDHDFWFRVPISPARKMRQTLIDNLISKSAIFEISPNIGKLYIKATHFSLWVWVWDRPQNMAPFGSDPNSKPWLYENAYQLSDHFRPKWRVLVWRSRDAEFEGAQIIGKNIGRQQNHGWKVVEALWLQAGACASCDILRVATLAAGVLEAGNPH